MKRAKIEQDSFNSITTDSEDDDDYAPEPKKKKPRNADTTKPVLKVKKERKPEKTNLSSNINAEPLTSGNAENKSIKPKKTKVKKENVDVHVKMEMDWEEPELLAEIQHLDVRVASNVVRLFDDDNSIPFIARYRREMTGHMDAPTLRQIKDAYDLIKIMKQKAALMIKSIQKLNKLTPTLEKQIRSCRTVEELELIHAPFKTGGKRSLAERAKLLGLEKAGVDLLEGFEVVDLNSLIDTSKKGLENIKNVKSGLQHIIADIISKDRDVLTNLQSLKTHETILLKSTKTTKPGEKVEDSDKYENYYEFTQTIRYVKPHQILAINRGENKKVLSVKIEFPQRFWQKLTQFCENKWLRKGKQYPLREEVFTEAVQDAIQRLLSPMLTRQIRSHLTLTAERASIEVFATNLKNLLLQPPYRGKTIMAIDPGFSHGCKVAVVSPHGQVLAVDKFFLLPPQNVQENSLKLKALIEAYKCEAIALGNGTACRETESFLSGLIQKNFFLPFDVTYTIVSEQGASIYSCSKLAEEEFPGMDPNHVSAVSIGRRLQDPLAELVKIEPKHLGVGMYQHDVAEKKLCATLDEVVSECVSFVGVDVNTASLSLLQKVAGLNSSRAQNIIEYRLEHGPFTNRQQLLKVKGIGEKTFEQCAGFIRVIPTTAGDQPNSPTIKTKKKGKQIPSRFNQLDRTWIHPESYNVVDRFLGKYDLKISELGSSSFMNKVNTIKSSNVEETLAKELETDVATIKLILEALSRSPDHDLRCLSQAPLFRKGLTSIEELSVGDILSGRITNVVHFGAFVDVGVGRDGLIHVSKLKNKTVNLGDRVTIKVLSVDKHRARINLDLISVS